MNNYHKNSLPGIAKLFAMLAGVLLFLVFGEPLFGVKPNLMWAAWLIGFLLSLVCLWLWLHWRNRKPR